MLTREEFRKRRAVRDVVEGVFDERLRQNDRWGEQNHPDGTSTEMWSPNAELWKFRCDKAAREGAVTWKHILLEEVYEALAEEDSTKLREELIQVAAVAAAWVEAIDRRAA